MFGMLNTKTKQMTYMPPMCPHTVTSASEDDLCGEWYDDVYQPHIDRFDNTGDMDIIDMTYNDIFNEFLSEPENSIKFSMALRNGEDCTDMIRDYAIHLLHTVAWRD